MGWIRREKTVEILYPEITRDDLKDHGIDTPWAAWYTLEHGETPDRVDIREITDSIVPVYNEDIVLTWWYGIPYESHDTAGLGGTTIQEMAGDIEQYVWELFMEELERYAEEYRYVWNGLEGLVNPDEVGLPKTPSEFINTVMGKLLADREVPKVLEDWHRSETETPEDLLTTLTVWITRAALCRELEGAFIGYLLTMRDRFAEVYIPGAEEVV